MLLLENEKIESAFIEKEINFSLSEGIKLDINCENCDIESFMNIEGGEFYPLHTYQFPPVKTTIKSLIFTLNINYEEDDPFCLIEKIELNKNPDFRFKFQKNDAIEQHSPSHNVSIKIPPELEGFTKEAEICFPDGSKAIVSKSTPNFHWMETQLNCLLASGMGSYRLRMRGRIGKSPTEWSNFVSFKMKGRRTLGRVFGKK